jgi:uncharacterized protein (TIGR02001 family)
MKKTLLALLALTCASSGLRAEEKASSFSITTDFVFVSEYVFRGIEQQDAAFQPAVTFTRDSLSLGVWTSQALSNRTANWAQGNEVDVWGTYGFQLGESVTATVGATAYLYPSARASFSEPEDTFEVCLGLSAPLGPLTGSVTWFKDFVLESNTFQFGLGYSIPLADDAGSVDFGAVYAFNDIGDGDGDLPGTGGFDYRYYALTAGVAYKLTPAATLKVGLTYTGVNRIPGAPKNLIVSVGITAGL